MVDIVAINKGNLILLRVYPYSFKNVCIMYQLLYFNRRAFVSRKIRRPGPPSGTASARSVFLSVTNRHADKELRHYRRRSNHVVVRPTTTPRRLPPPPGTGRVLQTKHGRPCRFRAAAAADKRRNRALSPRSCGLAGGPLAVNRNLKYVLIIEHIEYDQRFIVVAALCLRAC